MIYFTPLFPNQCKSSKSVVCHSYEHQWALRKKEISLMLLSFIRQRIAAYKVYNALSVERVIYFAELKKDIKNLSPLFSTKYIKALSKIIDKCSFVMPEDNTLFIHWSLRFDIISQFCQKFLRNAIQTSN